MTLLHVDPESYVPPFEQLRAQIAEKAGTGELAAGHRLPPVRRMAADLGLAPGTVARAYRELEQDGVVAGRGSRGTFVVGPPPPTTQPDALRAAAADYAQRAAAVGASTAQALDLVRSALAEHVGASEA